MTCSASVGPGSFKVIDELLAKETSRLSIVERYHVDLDVKGRNVLAAVEPAELSSMGLKALDEELKTMKDRTFYDLALSLKSPMVQSKEFRLKFARAESFDPLKASVRIEAYLKQLYDNFGEQGLLRPIRMTDLDKVSQHSCHAMSQRCQLPVGNLVTDGISTHPL